MVWQILYETFSFISEKRDGRNKMSYDGLESYAPYWELQEYTQWSQPGCFMGEVPKIKPRGKNMSQPQPNSASQGMHSELVTLELTAGALISLIAWVQLHDQNLKFKSCFTVIIWWAFWFELSKIRYTDLSSFVPHFNTINWPVFHFNCCKEVLLSLDLIIAVWLNHLC